MNIQSYHVLRVDDYNLQFHSTGLNGNFELRIFFDKLYGSNEENVYNVGFGVWDDLLKCIDDRIELNNGDTNKILATVAQAALSFLETHPRAYLYVKGSTPSRTRKYQMGIASYLWLLKDGYTVKGLINIQDKGELAYHWEDFRVGINYEAFLLFNS